MLYNQEKLDAELDMLGGGVAFKLLLIFSKITIINFCIITVTVVFPIRNCVLPLPLGD